jgi:hypothetical protein
MLKVRNTLLLKIMKKKDYYIKKIINLNQFIAIIFMKVIYLLKKIISKQLFFFKKRNQIIKILYISYLELNIIFY